MSQEPWNQQPVPPAQTASWENSDWVPASASPSPQLTASVPESLMNDQPLSAESTAMFQTVTSVGYPQPGGAGQGPGGMGGGPGGMGQAQGGYPGQMHQQAPQQQMHQQGSAPQQQMRQQPQQMQQGGYQAQGGYTPQQSYPQPVMPGGQQQGGQQQGGQQQGGNMWILPAQPKPPGLGMVFDLSFQRNATPGIAKFALIGLIVVGILEWALIAVLAYQGAVVYSVWQALAENDRPQVSKTIFWFTVALGWIPGAVQLLLGRVFLEVSNTYLQRASGSSSN